MDDILLYDSTICRLCAENNTNGVNLFTDNSEYPDLSSLINRYLPLKVRNDGKLPTTICPGCNIQLESTMQFFDLLVEGQKKLRDLLKQENELLKKNDRLKMSQGDNQLEQLNPDTMELVNYEQKNDENYGQQIIINILPDGSMYAAEHDMSLQMEGLEKPRRKRGRPPKNHTEDLKDEEVLETSQEDEDKQDDDDELDGDGRRRRKRKIPKRFSEVVRGKELERMFKEEGVIDDEDDTGERELDDKGDKHMPLPDGNEEVIGHLESQDGEDLGELIIMNRGRGRGRPKSRHKKAKYVCNTCGRGFQQRHRYIIHKSSHLNDKFECLKCNKQFTILDNFILHQKNEGHSGKKVIKNNCTNVEFLQDLTDMIDDNDINDSTDALESLDDKQDSKVQTLNEDINGDNVNDDNDNDNYNDNDNSNVNGTGTGDDDDEVDGDDDDEFKENSEIKEYVCDDCEELFTTQDTLEAHIKEFHNVDNPFVCNVCEKTFATEENLKVHVSTHDITIKKKTNKACVCDICGKVLNHPSSVVYHKEAEHNNGRKFVCNKCGKNFKHKQLLQRHQLTHSQARPYVCKLCEASFKTKANLINHQSTHTGEKKYRCNQCNRQFAHKTSLTLHYRWHNGEKPYRCNICHKDFSQNGNLQEHMRIHTGVKPYECEVCTRKFTTSSQFKLHQKRHTGERPWKCEYCGKTYLHKDTWKTHVRRHNDDRPFQCTHCPQSFTEQWALKKHMRTHTGEKPYQCNICDKRFADCSNLTKHRRTHREHKIMNINDIKAGVSGVIATPAGADGTTGVVAGAGPGELWQIFPSQEADDSLELQRVITDEGSEEGTQVIYVSYQDPNDPSQSRTLHFGMIEDKEAADAQVLPTLNVEEQIISKPDDAQVEIDLSDQNLQLQITDSAGNPIPLSIQDARQLLARGEFVSQLNDGQTIRVHSGVVADELAEQLGVHMQQPMATDDNQQAIALDDNSALVKVLEDDPADQIDDPADSAPAFELINEDGNKVRLVHSYYASVLANPVDEYVSIG
ncbi:zinc finger protein 271 isoform X1 [Microplitis demolitor]|uniref:zinc finger protein 271 isoform X1 n=2 Tax=Microplitis demolitor TaxID=69319 RepID=UPI0004CD37BB|nr:zinc finger protein 271 isoform X1 [Microplitis demolitor]